MQGRVTEYIYMPLPNLPERTWLSTTIWRWNIKLFTTEHISFSCPALHIRIICSQTLWNANHGFDSIGQNTCDTIEQPEFTFFWKVCRAQGHRPARPASAWTRRWRDRVAASSWKKGVLFHVYENHCLIFSAGLEDGLTGSLRQWRIRWKGAFCGRFITVNRKLKNNIPKHWIGSLGKWWSGD